MCGVQRETTTFNNDFIIALYVVFNERQQHLTFPGKINEVQMIFEVSEKNIEILDVLFNEKLQIAYTFQCNPL